MNKLSYNNFENQNITKIGGGVFSMFSMESLPVIFSIIGMCTLSSYMCSNSNKIFKKSTEEYFIYLWVGILLLCVILAYLQVNNYLIAFPPFVGPGIYILLVITLIMSCFFSL
jgi:hypothetical protein